MATRKRVSVDVLRQLLGESQTDQLLERLTPAKPTIPMDVRELNLAGTLFADPLTESRQWADTVPVLRRYFLERGRARRGLLSWLELASVGQMDGTRAETRARRPRRKVTDPELLERRRGAGEGQGGAPTEAGGQLTDPSRARSRELQRGLYRAR